MEVKYESQDQISLKTQTLCTEVPLYPLLHLQTVKTRRLQSPELLSQSEDCFRQETYPPECRVAGRNTNYPFYPH
ncbi:hypothetical protein HanIR_Chr05g0208741 [Helianthus annuus]|nr:hypothetical protein HanIR_Chr05g0208741 [Helianthus annuus]